MLTLARALMAKPKLLLLDEPVQGLTPLSIKDIKRIITNLNMRGLTTLIVEHNVHWVLDVSHKIYILETGKIILEEKREKFSETEYIQKIYQGDDC